MEKINIIQNPKFKENEDNLSKISYFDSLLDIIKIRLNLLTVPTNVNNVIKRCREDNLDEGTKNDFKKILMDLYFELKIEDSVGNRPNKYKIYIYIMESFLLGSFKGLFQPSQLRSRITSRNSYNNIAGNQSIRSWTKYGLDEFSEFLTFEENALEVKNSLEDSFSMKFNIPIQNVAEKFSKLIGFYEMETEKENAESLASNANAISKLLEDLGLSKLILPKEVVEGETKKVQIIKNDNNYYIYLKTTQFDSYHNVLDCIYYLMLLTSVTKCEGPLSFSKILSLLGLVYQVEETKFLGPKLKFNDKSLQAYNRIKLEVDF
uniref:DUF4806 domain-containing protein n=1 Tax=Parastrongyloides trichosuri TaxID=131310 RepID=A0A0N4ZLG2_PARTI